MTTERRGEVTTEKGGGGCSKRGREMTTDRGRGDHKGKEVTIER